ncbi:PAS domain-containing protein [Magnetospirillum sp. UT-4]|uniref:PAS domain-containing protein n=1 Tax=Magnetospirillum sp. UT-4 TaxID=2681467 RepID=UPI00138503C5|nr:PAS domain-containing protein [Magnetospirillum sp. UT-4]CAA7616730.1 Methyl-accepting chemotaxis protein [Magnetospirillum sp. UT-4]
MKSAEVTRVERTFRDDELIVSKTDPKGRITYCNDVFLSISGFREAELLGQPHNIIRHPDMPRTIFKLLWETLEQGREIFAYVVNRCKNGDHYWVLAHVAPDRGPDGTVTGFHSNRRTPDPAALEVIRPLYARLLAEETRHGDRKAGLEAGFAMLQALLADKGLSYDQFVLGL